MPYKFTDGPSRIKKINLLNESNFILEEDEFWINDEGDCISMREIDMLSLNGLSLLIQKLKMLREYDYGKTISGDYTNNNFRVIAGNPVGTGENYIRKEVVNRSSMRELRSIL